MYVSDTRLFPDIRFTCHGIITNWIVIAPALVMPVIKIRHTNNLTTTAATLNTSASNAVMITPGPLFYNFTMSNEITVQPGDILMIESNSTNQMFYQQYNGPHNYRLGNNNELIALDTNDYPLISVENNFYYVIIFFQCHIEPSITTISLYTVTSTISSYINILLASSNSYPIYSTSAVKMESTEAQQTSATTSLNNIPIFTFSTSTTSMMSTPVSTSQSTVSITPILLVGAISTVFILLVVTILVILIVSVLVYRRRWYKTSNGNDTFSSDERKANTNQQSDGNVH